MSEALEREIEELPKMDIAQLQTKWRQALKQAPPRHIRKQLLVPLLAYKLQEQAYGSLKPKTRQQLEGIAKGCRPNPEGNAKRKQGTRIKPGTQLLRQWNGKTHQVTVTARGFDYDGENYKSLSVIARRITGTRWSGPLFFGLKGHRS